MSTKPKAYGQNVNFIALERPFCKTWISGSSSSSPSRSPPSSGPPSTSSLPPPTRRASRRAPLTFPVVGNLLWLRKSPSELEAVLRSLHARLGPMVTIHIGPRPAVFVSSRALAHQALVHRGAVFADRPPPRATMRVISANQHNINSSSYGPTWRLLRRNLTAEILHPSRVRSYSCARAWVLDILVGELKSQPGGVVRVVDHFQYAMFCLLVLMCFGDRLEEKQIKQIEEAQRKLLLDRRRFNVLNFWPRLTKLVLRKRWKEFYELYENRKRVLVPLIRARSKAKREQLSKAKKDGNDGDGDWILSYVDTLLDLELPEEKRKLEEDEIMSLCNEFLNAGTDTTSTALQWIMANLVKYPEIQERLYDEIKSVVGHRAEQVKEEDLQRMGYLKAVVLEGLRRHPPVHFVVPHAVTEDAELGGYVITKDGSINFMVAEMGWDPEVWEEPMAFKPERFLNCGEEAGGVRHHGEQGDKDDAFRGGEEDLSRIRACHAALGVLRGELGVAVPVEVSGGRGGGPVGKAGVHHSDENPFESSDKSTEFGHLNLGTCIYVDCCLLNKIPINEHSSSALCGVRN
ncbi:hypothetical protein NL676_022423 [Syzygium grande]|nr:hypothetical protein NL676_022423 [Syzygium grande]